MAVNIKNILTALNEAYPFETCEQWDNVGLIIGSKNSTVKKVLICLDITDEVLKLALNSGCDTIIAHHPFIFTPIKKIDLDSSQGINIETIIKNDINIIGIHTNFDKSELGMNINLAKKLHLNDIKKLEDIENPYLVIGKKKFLDIDQLKQHISKALKMPVELIRTYGAKEIKSENIAVLGGAGADFIPIAKKYADIFITSDIKHHDGQLAYESDILLVDATHHFTEIHFVEIINNLLLQKFKNVETEIYTNNDFIVL